jgi:hypothetical protein
MLEVSENWNHRQSLAFTMTEDEACAFGLDMAMDSANPRIMRELDGELKDLLERLSANLDRVEILAGALVGFARSVPDYEPKFHHMSRTSLPDHELRR